MFRTLCNPDIFRTLPYFGTWGIFGILTSIYVQHFLRILCNLGIFRTWEIFRTMSSIYDVMFFLMSHGVYTMKYFIQNPMHYITYRLMMHSKLKHIQNSRHWKYCESLKCRLHRTLCNVDIFTTYVYLSPSILETRGIWWAVFYRTLGKTGIFKTRGIFQALSNIYYGEFYSESCVILAHLKPWHIQNQRHIHNTVKHLSRNILFKLLCNHGIFRTLLYSPLWYILKNKHIQNPSVELRE